MVESRASIGVKQSTKELLTYVSAQVQNDVERGDITWDEFLIYIAVKYLDTKGLSIKDVVKKFNIDIDEMDKINKKIAVVE
ncbi:MAG: hypothetical protein ACP5RZ_04345 [Thermoplasmata archaeon]